MTVPDPRHDARVDEYIAECEDFAQPILNEIRARLHASLPEVSEAIKWRMPFFLLDGAPFANMAGFRKHASFGFWRREAMPTGREGEAMGQFGRLLSIRDLPPADAFDALVREAAAIARTAAPARRRIAKPAPEMLPDFAAALDAAAAGQFAAFPPSAQRDYIDWIAEARRPETRQHRIAEAVGWIAEGKRRNWRHE